jgi:hypothetical protein
MAEDIAATLSDWLGLVRRARLGSTVKLVAFYLAGRANNDGSHILPGIARTAIECEVSTAVVRRALKTLRDAQLIQVVRRGNRRMRSSDEYRLIIGVDVLGLVDVPTPDEHDGAILAVRDREREGQQRRQARMAHRRRTETTLTMQSVETELPPVDNSDLAAGEPEPSTLTQVSVEAVNNAHFSAEQRSPERASTSPCTSPVEATPLSDGEEVRTDLTVSRARPVDNPQDQIFDGGAEQRSPDAGPAEPAGCDRPGCTRGYVLTGDQLTYCDCHPLAQKPA